MTRRRNDLGPITRSSCAAESLESALRNHSVSVTTYRFKRRKSKTPEPNGTVAEKKVNLSGAPRAAMPSNIAPMLASRAEKAFNHPDWIFEIKWDGYRGIAEVQRRSVRLYSRNHLSLKERFPSIADALTRLGHDAVLDGEIVVLDEQGRAQFQFLQNYRGPRKGVLVYYVFDLLYLDGYDLRTLPLLRRKELLPSIIKNLPNVRVSEHVAEHGTALFDAVAKRQMEGIVAKLANSQSVPGQRSKAWLKIKAQQRQQAVIGGFTIERGSRQRLGALLLGVYQGKELVYIGHTGTGFNARTLAEVRERLEPLIQKACPFPRRPKPNATVNWVRPELVCEISFACWTEDGNMRHPSFKGMRDDVAAATVHREEEDCEDAS
jgi:bifunctional non-homologous end joining protein LigD